MSTAGLITSINVMASTRRVSVRDESQRESDGSKNLQQMDITSSFKEAVLSSSRNRKKKKKKKKDRKKNKVLSSTSKGEDGRKHKHRENESHEVWSTDQDVELLTNAQPKPLQQKVQVKQRSIIGLLNTSSTAVAAGDTTAATDAELSTDSVARATGGLASSNYGVLLESKSAEKLCLSLALEKSHVETMLRVFKREEQLGTGEISTEEFFSMIREQPRQLTKGLFQEVGLAPNLQTMRFDDFVLCVATVATWSKTELLHYAFRQFDVDESGVMDERELRAFCEGLKSDSGFYFAKNVNKAREKLVQRERNNQQHYLGEQDGMEADALVDLKELAKGSAVYQVAFYPLLQLQQNVRTCALGEEFWARVALRRQEVEVVVHYMRLHNGTLPAFSMIDRIIAYLSPRSQANAKLVVRKLAILKFAEECQEKHKLEL